MRLLHPLAGSRFGIAMRLLHEHGGLRPAAIPAAVIMIASHGLRYASCELEIRRARKLADKSPPMPDPVFIVGHWRSGTTLLANLLSLDERYFFPTLVEAVSPHDFFPSPLEKLSRKMLPLMFPALRPMDTASVPLRQPFPQEDEMAMAALGAPSLYNALYFPAAAKNTLARNVFFDGLSGEEVAGWAEALDGFWRKLALLHPGKQPLAKNPAHTARIMHLLGLYPSARFVLLRRDTDQVKASTKRLFGHLWPTLALQRYDLADISGLTDFLHTQMADHINNDWQKLAAGQGMEISFNELLANPVAIIGKVQDWLGHSLTETHQHAIGQYLRNHPTSRD